MFSIRLILLGILVAGVGFIAWHYKATIEENKRLTGELDAANNTITALDAKFEAEMAISNNEEGILDEIRNAPNSDDGPVAPILDRTIDRLQ